MYDSSSVKIVLQKLYFKKIHYSFQFKVTNRKDDSSSCYTFFLYTSFIISPLVILLFLLSIHKNYVHMRLISSCNFESNFISSVLSFFLFFFLIIFPFLFTWISFNGYPWIFGSKLSLCIKYMDKDACLS